MTKQQLVLAARLEDLQVQLTERIARFEWVLTSFGETLWTEGLLEQCSRLEDAVSDVRDRLTSL